MKRAVEGGSEGSEKQQMIIMNKCSKMSSWTQHDRAIWSSNQDLGRISSEDDVPNCACFPKYAKSFFHFFQNSRHHPQITFPDCTGKEVQHTLL